MSLERLRFAAAALAAAAAGLLLAATAPSAPAEEAGWPMHGRTHDEQRFSPLDPVNAANVHRLGLAWYADMDTARGQEATPLVIDGSIYVTTAWSKVKANDGASGRLLWEYDPEVPGETAAKACCDVVNRGLGADGERLFLGTLDGRLVALDRRSGRLLWSVLTVDPQASYTITGAPRVIDGLVVIGNGGAEFGVRGYVTAYDAATGRQVWRFYTVPDRPGRNRDPHLVAAEKTWTGEWWRYGGGGTVWDSMAYDPALGLLYIGVGNGAPWNQAYRSPGGGDNLYLSSIVALDLKTGRYRWHYKATPADAWDYTATQHIILADLVIGGRPRKVLMQAPKNGFFYVLDRETGAFISANNYVPVNWAAGVDLDTGRPIENPEARYYETGKPFIGTPGAMGGHSWQPMAFDPKTGLVFIPANLAAFPYIHDSAWKPEAIGFNVGIDMAKGAVPAIPEVRAELRRLTNGALIAWDPVAQKERWRVPYAGPWNGGLLSTAGGLVFQGNAAGGFAAFAAESGKLLWSFPAQTGVMAGPVSYRVGDTQYVAVLAGWGGIWALVPGALHDVAGPVRNVSRLLVFKLDGRASLPPLPPLEALPLDPPPLTGSPDQVAQGSVRYARFCAQCHGDAGVGGAVLPDLRRSVALGDAASWNMIVHGGALSKNGMVSFAGVMNADQIDTIRHYVTSRAIEDRDLERAAARTASR